MPFHSIEPRRLYRQIADQIRSLIQSGEFPAGRALAARARSRRAARRVAPVGARGADRARSRRPGRSAHRLRASMCCAAAARGDDEVPHDAEPGPFELLRARYVIEANARRWPRNRRRRRRSPRSRMRSPRCSSEFDAASSSRWPAIGCSTCGIAEATGNGALVAVVEDAVGGAHGPAVQAARAPLRLAGAVDRGDGRAPRGAEGDRRATMPRARARAMQRHLNQAYKRFSTGWDTLH